MVLLSAVMKSRQVPCCAASDLYSPLLPQLDEVIALLESGKNVSPVGWVHPFHTPGVEQLEAVSR